MCVCIIYILVYIIPTHFLLFQTSKVFKPVMAVKHDAISDKERVTQLATPVTHENKEKGWEDTRRETEISRDINNKNERIKFEGRKRERKNSPMHGVPPVPAPRSQAPSHSHSPDGNNSDKDHESRDSDLERGTDEVGRDEKVVIGEASLQQRRSRSNSVTSTGTYNIGSPQQREKSSDSGDESENSTNLKSEKTRQISYVLASNSNCSSKEKVSQVVSKRATRPKSAVPPKLDNSLSMESTVSSSSRSKSPSVHQILETRNDTDEKEDSGTLEDESSEADDVVVEAVRNTHHTSRQHLGKCS